MTTYTIRNDEGSQSMEVEADSMEEAALFALNRLGWYVDEEVEEE